MVMTAEVCLLGRSICYLRQNDVKPKLIIPQFLFNNRHSNLEAYNIRKNRKHARFLIL